MDELSGRLRFGIFLLLLIFSAFILGARLLYWYVGSPQRFPINTIKIVATYQHITREELEQILDKYRNDSFFSLRWQQMKRELNALPWASYVQIERIWPDTVKIVLTENEAVALWNGDLMAATGKTFGSADATTDVALPHLSGPIQQQGEVLQNYQKLSKLLANYGLHAAALQLRENQAWELLLSNGIELRLGKRDLDKRVLRFCRAYPLIFADKSERLSSVDLRYARGMAVQWKEPVHKKTEI